MKRLTHTKNLIRAIESDKMKKYLWEKPEQREIRKARNQARNMKCVNGINSTAKNIKWCNTKSKWQYKCEEYNLTNITPEKSSYTKYETCILIEKNRAIIRNVYVTHTPDSEEKEIQIYHIKSKAKTPSYTQKTLEIDGEKYNIEQVLRAMLEKGIRAYEII